MRKKAKKITWTLILLILLLSCLLLWLQALNTICDQDVPFFNGVCVINKYIPW